MNPRSFRPLARVLKTDISTMLAHAPDAFDCVVFMAKDAEHDESVSMVPDVVGALDSDERAQEYDEPIRARAKILYDAGLTFEAMGGAVENFLSGAQPVRLLLSVPGLRKFSLIQWAEYPDVDSDGEVVRTVYVMSTNPVGRTLGAGVIYDCLPLPALGEVPAYPDEDDSLTNEYPPAENEVEPHAHDLLDVAGGY